MRGSRVASLFSYRRAILIKVLPFAVSWRIPAPGDNSHMHAVCSVHPIREDTTGEVADFQLVVG